MRIENLHDLNTSRQKPEIVSKAIADTKDDVRDILSPASTVTVSEVTDTGSKDFADGWKILADYFPVGDEICTENEMKASLDKPELSAPCRWHFIVAKDAQGIVRGSAVFAYLYNANAGFLGYVRFLPKSSTGGAEIPRGRYGMWKTVTDRMNEILQRDAAECGHPPIRGVFNEVEKPEQSEEAARRVKLYEGRGWRRLDVPYLTPSASGEVGGEDAELTPMDLMYLGFEGNPDAQQFSKPEIRALVQELYEKAYEYEDHPSLPKALEAVHEQPGDRIGVRPLLQLENAGS